MPRQGRGLERLVAAIERALADEAAVAIESPKHLVDRTTGAPREHDVVLTVQQGHHAVVVAIECRDRSRPIGAPDVEAFSAKCADTGVNQGIIVSRSGFRTTARKKAEHLGVRCLDLEEAEEFDWLIAPEDLDAHARTRVYACRWQVELVFKELKSHYRLDELPTRKPAVVEALLLASTSR